MVTVKIQVDTDSEEEALKEVYDMIWFLYSNGYVKENQTQVALT